MKKETTNQTNAERQEREMNLPIIKKFNEFIDHLKNYDYEYNVSENEVGTIIIVEVYSFGLYLYKNEVFHSFISEMD
jgi:hypothetical protein